MNEELKAKLRAQTGFSPLTDESGKILRSRCLTSRRAGGYKPCFRCRKLKRCDAYDYLKGKGWVL